MAEPALVSAAARVKWLAAPSSAAWLEQALAHADLVLIDHATASARRPGWPCS